MLTEKTIATIKEITPVVAENAETVTRCFYEKMFEGNPEVKAFFNQAHQHSGGQQRALAGAICAYFSNIDNLAALGPAVELIAQKHCSLGVESEHYPIVGKHLLAAIKEVMGDGATDEIIESVAEAYGVLADVCINREKEIYDEMSSAPGGWKGRRKFVVERIVNECDVIKSFYLRPEDSEGLPNFKPGQYITLFIEHPATPTSPRNYSLSDVPGNDYFRISVKKEIGESAESPDGLISSYLHDSVSQGDILELGPPCGEFTLGAGISGNTPVVLLGGGIGVTPLLSIAKSLAESNPERAVQFVQAARNGKVHAFANELHDLAAGNDHFSVSTFYDQPAEGDVVGQNYDVAGTVSASYLRQSTDIENAIYFFCGPKPFMQSIYRSLKQLGVDESRIRFEFFGPRQEIVNSENE